MKIIHSGKGDPEERLLCFRNKNEKPISDKKIRNTKTSFKKKKFRTHVPKKGVWKIFYMHLIFLRTFSSFPLESGAVMLCKKQLPSLGHPLLGRYWTIHYIVTHELVGLDVKGCYRLEIKTFHSIYDGRGPSP